MALSREILAVATAAVLAATPGAGYAQSATDGPSESYLQVGAAPLAAARTQADDSSEANAWVTSEAAGTTVDCRGVGLRIMAAEMSGARFVCAIAGAPAGDSSFTVQALGTADQNQIRVPLCTGSLAAGSG
ncbi:MAG TPA: hypothetical protein VKC57_17815, partial [Ktedonobacterales bacterium]|nr:hypothetical protein [Ktedonobacterales bacterium]